MPANDRLRLDDGKGADGRGEPATEPDKHQAIDVCQRWSLRHPTPKHNDLLSQDQNLNLQFGSRLKQRSQEGTRGDMSAVVAPAPATPGPDAGVTASDVAARGLTAASAAVAMRTTIAAPSSFTRAASSSRLTVLASSSTLAPNRLNAPTRRPPARRCSN